MRLLEASPPCSGVCSATGYQPSAAPPMAASQPPEPAPAPQNQQHLAFLQGWQAIIAPKITQLLTLLAGQEVSRNLAVAQVWTYLPVLTEGRQLLKAEQLCLLGDPELQGFHQGCAQEGVTVSQLGPMGKVWESGAVQVVQCAQSLNAEVHPCNRLPGALSRRIEECIYVPVYDRTGQVSQGVLAVVELLIRWGSHDTMIVANAISCITHLLDALQLSISNPHAQQQQAAPASGGLAASAAARAAAALAHPQPTSRASPPAKRSCQPGTVGGQGGALHSPHHSKDSLHNNLGWGGAVAAGGSGGSLGMGRSMSMRTFA